MPDLNPAKSTWLYQLLFEGPWPTAVAFVGERRIAAGNREGQLLVWDLPAPGSKDEPPKDVPADDKKKDKKSDEPPSVPPVRMLKGHDNGVTRLVALPDGKTLISASLDHTVRIWDLDATPTGEAEVIVDAETREREAKRGNKTALGAPGVKVQVQQAAHILQGHRDWVHALNTSRDGKRLISGDDSNLTIVWDLASGKQVSQWTGYEGNSVTSAALSPDGKRAFVADYCASRGDYDRPPAHAKFFSADDGSEKLDFLVVQFPKDKPENSYGYAQKWGKLMARGFVAADFSPDGKLVAAGMGGETDTGKVHLIDTESAKLVRTVAGHQYGVCDLMFSPDGKFILSCGRDTTVQVTSVEDGKEAAKLGKPRGGQFKDWLNAIALSPDNTWLAAADIAGFVQVWKLG